MKQICLFFIAIFLFCEINLSAQNHLTVSEGYFSSEFIPEKTNLSAIDIYSDFLYACDGDTIYCYNLQTSELVNTYGKPADYSSAYVSFINVSPDGTNIWAGFTVSSNNDDRIYCIDLTTGNWELKAHLTGNFDLEFANDNIFVSGLNSQNWEDPNSIFLLDISGPENHQKIIEIGGSSAGLAVDEEGNIYYSTYFAYIPNPNAIYRWASADILNAINNNTILTLSDAEKLSDMPDNGSCDCDIDEAGNLFFNSNNGAENFCAVWNGISGDGNNYDIIATSTSWLSAVKIKGDLLNAQGKFYSTAYGKAIFEIHKDTPPIVANPILDIIVDKNADDYIISLIDVFTDPDNDDDNIIKNVLFNSNQALISTNIINEQLSLSFTENSTGAAEIIIEALSNGLTVTDTFYVTVVETFNIAKIDNNKIVIYPNPSKGIFSIKVNSEEPITINIFDISGKLVYKNYNYINDEIIDISNKLSGIYIIIAEMQNSTIKKYYIKL